MRMTKQVFLILVGSLVLLLVGCSVITGGPQAAATEAFEQWAKEAGTPYEDVRYETLSDDGTFATVRVTAFFAESPEAGWREMQTDVECRQVAGEWACDEYLLFNLSEAEQQRILDAQNATATAVMATQVAAQATTTAEYEETIRATQTAQAQATASAEAAIATATEAVLEGELSNLYAQAGSAEAAGDSWLAAYLLAQIVDIRPDYRDAADSLEDLRSHVGHIVFTRGDTIYIMDGIGRNEEPLELGEWPALSPDGTQIAFWRGVELKVGPLWGEHTTRFIADVDEPSWQLIGLKWAPNGRQLAFTLWVQGERLSGFVVLDLDTGQAGQVIDWANFSVMPNNGWLDWSPDGTRLCFTGEDRSDRSGLYLLDIETGQPELLVAGARAACAWAPDGQQILFDADQQLYTTNLDGTRVESLVWEGERVGGFPLDWSPDGTKILYSSSDDVWVADPDGSYPILLLENLETYGSVLQYPPSWAR